VAWILGVLLACALGIINGLWLEQVETNELANKENEKKKKQKADANMSSVNE